ncbi:unnamed protein product [Sphagnum jensenii]|uniref:Uncharacterized protein n=1 Tax=Sphagnum jensenii TaxID=128206 RepID=A0ABP1C1H1_9BRYO
MDRPNHYLVGGGYGGAGLLALFTMHYEFRRLTIIFQHGFGDEYLLMAHQVEGKPLEAFRRRSHEVKGNPTHPVSSSTNFRPVVHSAPAHSEFALNSVPPASRISKERHLILVREI